MEYDDPSDLNFPYEIAPGKISRFMLQEYAATGIADSAPAAAQFLSRTIGRPRVWVEALSMAGTVVRTSAEDAIAWTKRPVWLRGE